MNNYYHNLNEILLELKKEFYKYHDKKEWSIIAISYPNFEHQNTWHLMDIDYIERFKNKQPILRFGHTKVDAVKYPAYTKLVFHEDKNKRFVITPEKEEELKKKNITIDNFQVLAERVRLAHFGEIWNITDERLASLYREQLISLKIGGEIYNAYEYRSKIFIREHKLTRKKSLVNVKGQIIMKQS